MEQAWQDFGQKVDLTARLREILINYPEGTSILKEIVQNADDAKATTVKFCLDYNSYPGGSVLSRQMGQFQGPALLSYNDGVFSEKDFESISRIGDSKKREQVGKTGRFGVGFNAIYHLTDVPSFMSGQHLVIFDPHCKHLPAISAANPGKKINFVEHDVNSSLADQVAPYKLFGCTASSYFAGTLFRFPLRTQEQADASTISKQVYTTAKIGALFSDLQQEAHLVLLFLKSVRSIEVLELQPGQQQPQLLFSCSIANASPALLQQRALFLHAAAAPPEEQVAGTYQMELLTRDVAAGSSRSRAFLVCQRRGGAQLLTMATELSRQFQVPLVAWGAVAAEISSSSSAGGAASQQEHGAGDEVAVAPGRAFCFLPLPACTGLPLHINGYFELSSNRRDVWHGSDMAGAGRLRAQWNEALLQLVVAPAYLDLLAAAAKLLGHGSQYARLWPSCDAPEPWQGVVRQLYGHLPGKQLLWTAAGGGRWLPIGQCLFPDAACLQQQLFHLLTPDEAAQQQLHLVKDAQQQLHSTNTAGTAAGAGAAVGLGPLGKALLLLDMPLLDMPSGVLNMMQRHLPELPQSCTPAAARATVIAHADRITVLQRQEQVVPLLAYCLADVDLAAGAAACQQLLRLRLLPLADGSLAEFAAFGQLSKPQEKQPLVFVVTDELELLLVGSQKHLLLDNELLGPALTAKLSLAASYACLNLQLLTVQRMISSFLPQLLPSNWRHATAVAWSAGPATEADGVHASAASATAGGHTVTWQWLQGLWQWLTKQRSDMPLLLSCGWPLLPVLGGQLVPLLPFSASAIVAPGADSWPDGLAVVLGKLGCFVLDTSSFELPTEALLQHCVHRPGGPGVAAAICAALGLSNGRQQQQQQQQQLPERAPAQQVAEQLTAADARLLRTFLLQQCWFSSTAGDAGVQALLLVCQRLPLFELAYSSASLQEGAAQQQQQQEAERSTGTRVALEPGLSLAPAGVYTAALDSRFLAASSDQEAAVLVAHLGVSAPTAASVYRDVLLPQLTVLPEATRDAAMLHMLRFLPELQQQDRGFARLLAQTAFVPSGAGQLHTPGELYDPRVPELVALLDPDACFPAPAFCSADLADPEAEEQQGAAAASAVTDSSGSGSFSSLAALQQLGLRSTADLGTLVLAARYVDETAKQGDEDLAVARGKALLSYLDTEAERLVGRHTAITSAAAAAIAAATAQHEHHSSSRTSSGTDLEVGGSSSSGSSTYIDKRQRPGRGLFSAMQSLWGLAGRGPQQQQQQQQQPPPTAGQHASADSAPTTGSLQQLQQQQPAQLIAAQWAELARTCWCPILAASPEPALPWKSNGQAAAPEAAAAAGMAAAGAGAAAERRDAAVKQPGGLRQQRLAAPCAARPRNDLWLVSAVMSVVDGDCRSPVLLSGLGWSAALPGAVLASQLAALGAAHRHVHDAALAQKLARVVPVLYGALAGLAQQELAAAAAVLEGQPTVWVGNGFVPAERVAFKGGLDLSPHLYVLPLELSPFRELLAVLGAQEAFSAAQYTTLLQDLGREAGGKHLAPQQLGQALAVVQALADVVGASGGGATAGRRTVESSGKQQEALLVPDDQGVLRPAAELAFDDAPWLDAPTAGLDNELHLVHPRISAPVAEALGVASRRRLMLAASADCLALGLAGAGGAVEAFGQSEALTTRLRHIIQDYPEGPGVLLELVQNADDAGASKAAFLLDARQHGTASLLGPGMAAWQGPALLAYNDATFSPGDFAAIARIGQDGKMAQPAAIGRFGLGFNAVYHLTDLPSFVSGQHLVLFDPHAKYLPGASAAQPGLRVNLNRGGGNLIRQFPDAFTPYMHFGCSMEGSYPGTLFRFPLRSSATASTSDIKSSPTTAAQALELLHSLAEVLPHALLFLKSLKQIEVYVIGDTGEAAAAGPAATAGSNAPVGGQMAATDTADSLQAEVPRLLFRATLSALDGTGSLQQPITHFVSSGGGGSGAQQLEAFYRRLATTPEQQLPSSIGRVQLTMTLPGSSPSTAADSAAAAAVRGVLQGTAGARAAAVEVVREDWLVCNQLGGGNARAIALKAWKEDKVKMVPWVGVATRLSSSGYQPSIGAAGGGKEQLQGGPLEAQGKAGSGVAGRAFCFLPLPASTGLPVHINGYFELSSNRRDVWHGSDMAGAGRLRAQWNEALLEAAGAPAYAALLLEAAQLLGPSKEFWQLLPLGPSSVPEPWLKVAAALYAKLATQPVLWTPASQGSWLTPRQALLPDAACFGSGSSSSNSATGSAATSVDVTSSGEAPATAAAATGVAAGVAGAEAGASGAAAAVAGAGAMSMGHIGSAAGASYLSQLLVGCGVPLVMALSDEQQRCLQQWTPGTQQVCPALARKLVASNPNQLARVLTKKQQQQQQQQGEQQPAAAVLLQYCLSDVDVTTTASSSTGSSSTSSVHVEPLAVPGHAISTGSSSRGHLPTELLGALRQLNGLPLLPAADGSLHLMKLSGQSAALGSSSSSSSSQRAAVPGSHSVPAVYVPVSVQEQQLLGALPQQLLHPHVGLALQQQLVHIASSAISNITLITCQTLDAQIMPQLLPTAWRGQLEVEWVQPGTSSSSGNSSTSGSGSGSTASTADVVVLQGTVGTVQQQQSEQHQQLLMQQRQQQEYSLQQQPSRDFIKLLWQWMADRADAADLSDWPVLPTAGGKLRQLQQPAQVLQGGDWTEQLTSALLKLGCCLLDTQLLSMNCPALAPFVQQPTAAGMLDALAAADAAAAAGAAVAMFGSRALQQHVLRQQQLSSAARPLQLPLQQLSAAERHHLRTYLLQRKWFAAKDSVLSAQQLQMLRALPIYEVYPPLQYEQDVAATAAAAASTQGRSQLLATDAPTATAAAGSSRQGLHVPLARPGREPTLLLAPVGVSCQVLGSKFLHCESAAEEELLVQHLGVQRLAMSTFFAEHLAVAPQQLECRGLISSLVYVLQDLQQLMQEDPTLPSVLGDLPIIPTRHRSSAGQLHLAAPKALFDPRNSIFRELLDPLKHFPAPPFDGSDGSVAAAVSAGDGAGNDVGGGQGGGSTEMALTAVPVSAHAFSGSSKQLLSSLVECGLKTRLDLQTLVLAAETIAAYPADDPAPHSRTAVLLQQLDLWAQQHLQLTREDSALLKQLHGIPWCPVLLTPPHPGLPWPHQRLPVHEAAQADTAAEAARGQELADSGDSRNSSLGGAAEQARQPVLRIAPKLVAPAHLAWLASAPLRLLAWDRKPSLQLQRWMGWTLQQVLRPSVAIAQLMELGKMYSAGQVHDADLQAELARAAGTLYSSLAQCLGDAEQHQLLDMTLCLTPCVWVGSGFTFPAVAAMPEAAPSSTPAAAGQEAAADPVTAAVGGMQQLQQQLSQQQLLWTVPQHLLQEHTAAAETLRAIGVQREWDFAAFAIALAVLAERTAGQALPEDMLSLALLLADAAAQALLSGTGSVRQLQQPGVMAAAAALQAKAAAAVGNSAVGAVGGADVLLLPDSNGCMAPPGDLYYNDATWLEVEGLRLAHHSLSQATCEALGVRSMRYQHEVNQQLTANIPCPSVNDAAAAAAVILASCSPAGTPAAGSTTGSTATNAAAGESSSSSSDTQAASVTVSGMVGPPSNDCTGAVSAVLLALLAWADQLKTADAAGDEGSVRHVGSMGVVLDERQHGTESLLHPGLAKLQGPSLCIALHGLSLSSAQLSQLIPAGHSSFGRRAAGAAADAAAAGEAPSPMAAVQLGLASVWAISDVLQVMSGDTTYYWDPSGAALAQTAAELRSPAPRGRSVRHTQPGVAQRFADQWSVWSPCRSNRSSAHATAVAAAATEATGLRDAGKAAVAASEAAEVDAPAVVDAVYIRLPLRLQDQGLHGSALAAAAGAVLGQGGRALGLSLKDVRRQVAALGPAATKSLLFLGQVYRVSIAHWPAGAAGAAAAAASPLRLWQGSVLPSAVGSMPLRTGSIVEQQLVRHQGKDRGGAGAGSLLARMAAGARGGSSSRTSSYRNCWHMNLQAVSRPAALAQLANGQSATTPAGPADSSGSNSGDAAAAQRHEEAKLPASEQQQQQQQQQHGSTSSSSSSYKELGAASQQAVAQATAAAPRSSDSDSSSSSSSTVVKQDFTYMVSAVCELLPHGSQSGAYASVDPLSAEGVSAALAAAAGAAGLLPVGIGGSGLCHAGDAAAANQPVCLTAAVAICVRHWSGGAAVQQVTPAGGLFSSVAVPCSGASLLGSQNFMVNLQGTPGVIFTLGRARTAASRSSTELPVSPSAAATQQLQQQLPPGSAKGNRAVQQLMLARIATAWQELVMMLNNMRLPGLYCLVPDLVRAIEAGDADAAQVFKSMCQAVASLPIWQLHNGRLVHLQEGAFLPPREAGQNAAGHSSLQQQHHQQGSVVSPQSQQQEHQQQRRQQPHVGVTAGLGPEARHFITQHLPLFRVPWLVVAQLEAAHIPGLRLVSPLVLRPLLRRLGEKPLGPGDLHPFAALTPVQALQLLEFCCSDLMAPDRASGNSSSSGSGGGGAGRTGQLAGRDSGSSTAASAPSPAALGPRAVDAATAVAARAPAAAAEPNDAFVNLPEGAVTLVNEVLGPGGLTVLRGLANQLQLQLTQGIDDVLNTVMDAMTEVPQQAGPAGVRTARGTAAAVQEAAAAAAAGAATSRAQQREQPAPDTGAVDAPLKLNMNRVNWLRGLPVPTAAGTVAVLGSSMLFVYPESCQPAPQSLLPSHLLHQFVSADCVAALAWALKYPELRDELNLAYYGLQHLAGHLNKALGPTWEFFDLDGPSSSSSSGASSHRGAGPAAAGRDTSANVVSAAAAAVPWNDGAAGGPYMEWLQRLWQVMLHIIAAAPEWHQDLSWGAATAAAASSTSAGARVADSLRNAAERARGLGRGLAEVLAGGELNLNNQAAALAAVTPDRTVSRNVFGSAVSNPAAEGAGVPAGGPSAADLMWQPLADWPLLPLADGRLLKMKHRDVVLAVLPEYQAVQAAQAEQAVRQPESSSAWAESLSEPWSWLLPAAVAAGMPVLDPRFSTFFTTAAAGAAAAAPATAAAATAGRDAPTGDPAGAEAAAAQGVLAAALPVDQLLGLQPVLGRPPFLGPLVCKLAAARAQLGSLADTAMWDEATWSKLFTLLADNPPRDVQLDGVTFLRSLPMYRRLQVSTVPETQQQQQQQREDPPGQLVEAPVPTQSPQAGLQHGGQQMLVALGEESGWVLTPQAVSQECAGLLSLPSLPEHSVDHILEHRTNWGELYNILGLTPASLADFMKGLLLPHLLELSPADRKYALNFIQHHWSSGSWNLGQDQEFLQALSGLAFVPARLAPAAAAGSAAAARAAAGHSSSSTSSSSTSGGASEQLYLAKQMFDPTVPLFSKIMVTMGVAALGPAAGVAGGAAAAANFALFPAAPYDSAGWLQVLRALGLQCKVTPETFIQLARHIAVSAAALAAAGAIATTPRLRSNSSASSSTAAGPSSSAGLSDGTAYAATASPAYSDVSSADATQVASLVAAADALLSHLRSQWTGLGPEKAFWRELGQVQFVPATLGLPGVRSSRQVFTSCANAAQHKDWFLVWSVMPLLSDGRSLPSILGQQLGMRSPPPLSAVLQHLHMVGADGGEDLLASWPDSLEPIADLTSKILEHLDREGLSARQAQELSTAAFIPVAHGSRLVAPQQLFMRLGGAALAPFAWEVPGQYVGKLELLKQLGVKEEPRAEDLVHALQRFELQLAGRRMNPNELSASLRLLAYLCSRSSAGDASYLAAARRSHAALLVPTAGGLLMPASRVVHVGTIGGGVAAARLSGRADSQHLVLAHPQLSDHVCRWLGVPSLSDVLAEELDPSVNLTPLQAIGSTSLQHVQQLLSSPHFASAVFSITAAHATAVPALRQLSLGAVSQVCTAAGAAGKLVFVEKLASRVVLRSTGRDVTRDTASRQVYEYYDSSSGTMYVAVPPPGLALSSLLAQVLSRALGSPFTLPLHPLLEVPDAAQLPQLQPVLHAGGYDQELESALASGQVGSPVQPADKPLLRLRPLRHYFAGELVAVKRRSNTAAASTAAAPAASGMEGADAGDGSVLCYGRVAVDAAPAPGQAAYRLSVEVDGGVYETLLSTQVFCFQSGAQGAAAVASPTDNAAAAAVPGPGGVDGTTSRPEEGASLGSSSAVAGGGAAPSGHQMAASEVAGAVADMLNAAGMPLDLDRQQLLQKALAADQQLSQATAAIAELRQEAQKKEQELDALRSSWQCRVCFSRDVNQAFVGCGHMYCSGCMPSLAKCPVCRTASAKIKLYR